MKLDTRKTAIIVLIAILLTTIVASHAINTYHSEVKTQKERAKLNAQVYAQELNKDFQRGITITETLAALIEENNGSLNNFDAVAKRLTRSFVGSVQLAPNCVVTKIYPLKGNEEGLGTLMDGRMREATVMWGKKHKTVTMQGPFGLRQGGQGIAIRDPVFIKDSSGHKKFWGCTIVIIKSPMIFKETLGVLSSFDYDYCVDSTISPVSDSTARVATSITKGHDMKDAQSATFETGGCTWTLRVKPKTGWISPNLRSTIVGGVAVSLLLLFLTWMIFGLFDQRQKLRFLAERDELTGLYSRRGFINILESRAKSNPKGTMTVVFLDLDDFKLVNDQYGHHVGDEALRNMARNLRAEFPKDALIGRIGGDEFCVVLNGLTAQQSDDLVKKMIAADQTFTIDSRTFRYTISAGYALYPDQTDDQFHLLVLADQALYAAKLGGKHRYAQYDPSMITLNRTQLGFTLNSFAAGMPGGIIVCRANGGKEVLFVNDQIIRLFECDNLLDFMKYAGSGFLSLVHPDDRDKVGDILRRRRAILEGDATPKEKAIGEVADFRILAKSGKVKEVIGVGRHSFADQYGPIFYVFMRERETVVFDNLVKK